MPTWSNLRKLYNTNMPSSHFHHFLQVFSKVLSGLAGSVAAPLHVVWIPTLFEAKRHPVDASFQQGIGPQTREKKANKNASCFHSRTTTYDCGNPKHVSLPSIVRLCIYMFISTTFPSKALLWVWQAFKRLPNGNVPLRDLDRLRLSPPALPLVQQLG